ncbi:hypothetical protein [Flavobacterium sp.]|uniref:hypothetical protein n=1 Tax=Flavobacterium sp. TaxID=239 RepID=UPI0025BF5F31|nr:hypothetical protein [Flavobacterium sp.]
MKNKIAKAFFLSVVLALLGACANDELTPYYDQRKREIGKIVIHGYNALSDSIQMTVNGKLIEIGNEKNNTAFVKKIEKEHDFVFFNDEVKTLVITNKKTSQILGTYLFTNRTPVSSLYFYAKENLWIDDVSFLKPGTLSQTGYAGFKFIFPSLNKYSGSTYKGALDGIITKSNGQVLGIVKNISKDAPSDFIEFPFSTPAAIKMELVKHDTKESYITGQKVIVAMTMTNNKSKLIILEEEQDVNGKFSGVGGVINLADYFTF